MLKKNILRLEPALCEFLSRRANQLSHNIHIFQTLITAFYIHIHSKSTLSAYVLYLFALNRLNTKHTPRIIAAELKWVKAALSKNDHLPCVVCIEAIYLA